MVIQHCVGSEVENLLYVADLENGRIQVFNAMDGNHIRYIGEGEGEGPGQLNCPCGITALLEGEGGISELFVADSNNDCVSVFDMSTGAFKRHIGHGHGEDAGEMNYPYGVVLSLTGVDSQAGHHLLYVSECENNRIQIFDATTGVHVGFLGEGELSYPYGLRLHAGTDGRSLLFVTDVDNKRVVVYEV